MKIFVGFVTKSSAKLPNFFCPLFRHCAVVIDNVLIQVATDGIRCFRCGRKEIKKLEKAGWVFVELPSRAKIPFSGICAPEWRSSGVYKARCKFPFVWRPVHRSFSVVGRGGAKRRGSGIQQSFISVRLPTFLTCTGFAKRALGIYNPFIWTPDQLFRKLMSITNY